ncbi:MAG TPA: hypothetical protein VMM18_15500 [Gemmatimonadaceae bacterium]|nr:hypothetical protein [Gemmatimonadaceae bacterium]
MLIARQDSGDVTRAAQRLQIPIEALHHIEETLTGSTPHERLLLLACVVRRYDADACWLLTGSESRSIADLPPDLRIEIAGLLSEIGNRIVADYWERRPPPSPPS